MSFPCGVCHDEVEDSGIGCDRCQKWFHALCEGIEISVFEVFDGDESLLWFCSSCKFKVAGELKEVSETKLELGKVKVELDRLSGELKRLEMEKRMELEKIESELEEVMKISGDVGVQTEKVGSGGESVGCQVDDCDVSVGKLISNVRRGVEENSWKKVKGRSCRSKKVERFEMEVKNSFDVLGDEVVEKEVHKVIVLGDSQVRYVGKHLNRKSKVCCYPGAGVSKIVGVLEDASFKVVDQAADVVIHVGGNYILRRGSEELYAGLERALRKARDRGSSVTVTAILPRLSQGREWLSRALGMNSRLETLCHRLGVGFLDLWDSFYGNKGFYARDGVHFSYRGVRFLGQELDRFLARSVLPPQGNC